MADADKTFQILLRMMADTSALNDVKARVGELQVQLQAQADALGQSWLYNKITAEEYEAELAKITAQQALLTEQSIARAAKEAEATAAQAAGFSLANVNLTALGRSAATLTNQLASGNVSVRSMGSFMGQLLGPMSIAGLAAFEIYKGIAGASDAMLELDKTNAKMADELNRAVGEWAKMAKGAQDFGDQVKMADKVQSELDKMAVEMAAFRAKELGFWAAFWNEITKIMSSPLTFGIGGTGAVDAAKQAALTEAQNRYNAAVKAGSLELLQASDNANTYANAMKNPAQAMADFQTKLTGAEGKLEDFKTKLRSDPGNEGLQKGFIDATREVNTLRGNLDAAGTEMDKLNRKTKDGHELQHAISAELRDQANLLAQIRGNQQLIAGNSFLTPDQKNAQLYPLITQEITAMNAQLERDRQLQREASDPQQWQQLQGKIIQARVEIARLVQEQQKMSFKGGVLSDLTQWVSSFGTTAHQVANTIQQTIGVALQSLNQLILTGKFNAQQFLEQIANIGLQFLENMLLQRAMMAVKRRARCLDRGGDGTGSGSGVGAGRDDGEHRDGRPGGRDGAALGGFGAGCDSRHGVRRARHLHRSRERPARRCAGDVDARRRCDSRARGRGDGRQAMGRFTQQRGDAHSDGGGRVRRRDDT
jgi:predicted  nucleic acid-binding Zn-ribbon protein